MNKEWKVKESCDKILNRQRTGGTTVCDTVRNARIKRAPQGKTVSVKRQGIYEIGKNDKRRTTAQTFTSRCSLPSEEAPLITPTIVDNVPSVVSTVLTVITIIDVGIVKASIGDCNVDSRFLNAGIRVCTVLNACIRVCTVLGATDGELEGQSDVKKRQCGEVGINPHKQHHRRIHVGRSA